MTNHFNCKEIHNILFDFGGVILNISHKRLEDAFRALGVPDFEKFFNQVVQSELFQKFEKGEISPKNFRSAIRDMTGIQVSDDVLDTAWNSIIGDYTPERIDLLVKIKKNYRLFLLSNTNEIHYDYYIGKFRKEYGFDFHSLFHNTYWSFKMGKRKPDPESFIEIIDKESIIPGNTLFIDDSKQNIIAAEVLGIKTCHLSMGLELTGLFQNSLLI
jgi:putative hydrolase of the HAD superfamily